MTLKADPTLIRIRRMLCMCVVILTTACGSAGQDTDELLPRDARPELVFATQESQLIESTGSIIGTLEERGNCLRLVAADRVDYVIAWPHGAVWEVGGMGRDTFVVIRDRASTLVAKVGDTIQIPGARSPERIAGCDGPVWSAGGPIQTLSARPDGVISPSPSLDQMGTYALQFVRDHYAAERSGQPTIVLSRTLTAREVYDLVTALPSATQALHTQASTDFCAGHPFPGSWYCDPQAAPFVVVAHGNWWTNETPSTRLGTYLIVLIDRRTDNPVPIMVGYLPVCNDATLRALIPATPLPTLADGEEC